MAKHFKISRSNLALIMIVVGCVMMFLPSMMPECGLLYILGVWIWPFCFLFYGRFSKHRFSQPLLFVFLAFGLIIRFYGVLGEDLVQESVFLMIFAACAFWVPFAWDVRFCKTESHIVYTLVFPVVYGTLNLILSACNVVPVCNLAYAQYDNKLVLQITSVIGEFGLTFLITWFASMSVYAIEHYKTSMGRQAGFIAVAILLGVHGFGAIKMYMDIDNSPKVKIAQALGPKLNVVRGEWEVLSYERNLESFNAIIKSAANQGAEMLAFSEEAFSIADTNETRFVVNAQEKALEYGIPVLLTLEVDASALSSDGKFSDKAILIDKHGKVVGTYVKHNAVPVVESRSLDVGDGKIPTVSLEIGDGTYRVSFVICYDANFSDYVRQLDPTTQLFFSPSWDWKNIDEFHYKSIGIRSVEHGTNVIMTTYDGVSLVSDIRGNELFRAHAENVGYEKVFMVTVPTASEETFYAKYGGAMNISYLIGTLFFIAFGSAGRKKDDDDDEEDDDDDE